MIGQININSIRNKFDMLQQYFHNNLDAQFEITGFTSPDRIDRNKFGGGLPLYVREDITSKIVIAPNSNEIENIY